jgi:transposase-like protein
MARPSVPTIGMHLRHEQLMSGRRKILIWMSKSSKGCQKLSVVPEVGDPERRDGERSEPARSRGDPTSGGASSPTRVPDPEISAKPTRRRFTAEYNRSIVEQVVTYKDAGAFGALLRARGLYSSHLSTWRRQARQGEMAALTINRGRPPAARSPSVLRTTLPSPSRCHRHACPLRVISRAYR